MKNLPKPAKLFISAVMLAAIAAASYAFVTRMPSGQMKLVALLLLAMAAARMKLTLPGLESSMAMNLPFILIGLVELSLPEAMMVGGLSTFVHTLPKPGQKVKLLQAVFNVCNMVNAVAIAFVAASRAQHASTASAETLLIAAAALAFFLADTLPVATIISLTEKQSFVKVWREMALLTFPYFVLSAGVATMVATGGHYLGWKTLLLMPIMCGVYLSFRLYFERMTLAGPAIVEAVPWHAAEPVFCDQPAQAQLARAGVNYACRSQGLTPG
jgi:hypothetical protein